MSRTVTVILIYCHHITIDIIFKLVLHLTRDIVLVVNEELLESKVAAPV
jgi:hypothetical protein